MNWKVRLNRELSIATELIENRHCEAVVLSIGAAGVILATHEGCQHLRAPVVPIRSKVGADDSTSWRNCMASRTGRFIG